jgi:hypothetical protein
MYTEETNSTHTHIHSLTPTNTNTNTTHPFSRFHQLTHTESYPDYSLFKTTWTSILLSLSLPLLKYLCQQMSYGINWKLVFYSIFCFKHCVTLHHFLFAWTFFSKKKLRTRFLRRLSITDPSRSGPRDRSSMWSSTLDPATSGCPPSSAPSGSSPAVRIFVIGVLSSPTSLCYRVEEFIWKNTTRKINSNYLSNSFQQNLFTGTHNRYDSSKSSTYKAQSRIIKLSAYFLKFGCIIHNKNKSRPLSDSWQFEM